MMIAIPSQTPPKWLTPPPNEYFWPSHALSSFKEMPLNYYLLQFCDHFCWLSCPTLLCIPQVNPHLFCLPTPSNKLLEPTHPSSPQMNIWPLRRHQSLWVLLPYSLHLPLFWLFFWLLHCPTQSIHPSHLPSMYFIGGCNWKLRSVQGRGERKGRQQAGEEPDKTQW